MTTLIVGASGATGKQLVQHLLNREQKVKVIVRSSANIPESWKINERVLLIKADISDMDVTEMAQYVKDCHAVTSCLGHNLTMKGIFGRPRKLVTNAVRLLCEAIERNTPEKPVRFILMNTAGNRNRDLNEKLSVGQRAVVGIIRTLVPPQSDNEKAADYLRANIGQQDSYIEWVVVRPDTLMNDDDVTDYRIHESPVRSAIFNPGKTSRINVAHFIAQLTASNDLWQTWKGKMPVIYNKEVFNLLV